MAILDEFKEFIKNPKYKAVVYDRYYDSEDHNMTIGNFNTPEDAFMVAQKFAEKTGFTGVDYWVEYDFTPHIDDDRFYGRT